MRNKTRPNVTPAKYYSNGDKVKNIVGSQLFKKGCRELRTSIVDLCDFCLMEIRVHKWQMKFRNHGYKFACSKCYKDKKFKFGKDKIIKQICFTPKK